MTASDTSHYTKENCCDERWEETVVLVRHTCAQRTLSAMARRAGVAMPCGGRHVHVVHALTARKKYQLRSPRRKKAWPRTTSPPLRLTTSPPLRYTCRSRKLTSYRAISHLAAKAAALLSEKACRAHRAHAVGTLPGLPSRGTALGVCSSEHSPTGAVQAPARARSSAQHLRWPERAAHAAPSAHKLGRVNHF